MKPKVSIAKLQKALTACHNALDYQADTYKSTIEQKDKKIKELETKLNNNLLNERIKLCHGIGQLTEAVAKAIQFVVTKEQM